MTALPILVTRLFCRLAILLATTVYLPAQEDTFATPPASNPEPSDPPDFSSTHDIHRQLTRIILPRVEFCATPFKDAVAWLQTEADRCAIDTLSDHWRSALTELPAAVAARSPAADTPVTLELHNLPFVEALRYTARQANLILQLQPRSLAFVPVADWTDPLYVAEFRVPPDFIPGRSTDRRDARPLLAASGVTFPPGASATFLPATNRLAVRNTECNLQLLYWLTLPHPLPRDDKDCDDDGGCGCGGHLLERLRIPEVDFQSTPLSDAVEFLRQESYRNNPTPNPEARWLNILLKLPVSGSAPTDLRVTLSQKNTPLLDLLRELARQTGLKLLVDSYVVSLLPPADARKMGELGLADWRVPPTAAAAMNALPPFGPGGLCQDALPWLKEKEVPITEDTRAIYLPANHRLMVIGSQETLDAFDLVTIKPRCPRP